MKYSVALLACLSVAVYAQVPPDVLNKMKGAVTQCVMQTGANPAEIKNLIGPQIPEGKNACLMACVMKKNNAMNSDNTINTDVIKGVMAPMKDSRPDKYDEISAILDKCKLTPSSDECTAAKNFKQCMVDNSKNLQP